ncbi:MAG: hypothetical protein ACIALR_07390, partial [Blastopirellula sp. JB062]
LRQQFVAATTRVHQRSVAAAQQQYQRATQSNTTSPGVAPNPKSPVPLTAQRNPDIRPLSIESETSEIVVPVDAAGPFPRKRTAELRR